MFIKNLIDLAKAKIFLEKKGLATIEGAARYMAQRAFALAPKDTLFMAKSIDVSSSLGGKRWNVFVTTPYAIFVEYGHYSTKGTWIPPQPFMRNARDDTARAFPSIAGDAKVLRPDDAGAVANLGTTFTT